MNVECQAGTINIHHYPFQLKINLILCVIYPAVETCAYRFRVGKAVDGRELSIVVLGAGHGATA